MTESSLNAPAEWHRLFDAALNNTLDEAAATRLAELLRDSATARELWFLYGDNECGLAELAAVEPVSRPSVRPTLQNKKSNSWPRQGSLAAAVAGLVVGVLSASLAWAYVGLQSRRTITLLQESFESGPAPLVSGVPIEPGYWSGDYSAIVSEQQAVKPASEKKMLRFLRGDYQGRSIPSSHSSDVFRLVDVRPYRREFADGGAVVHRCDDPTIVGTPFHAIGFAPLILSKAQFKPAVGRAIDADDIVLELADGDAGRDSLAVWAPRHSLRRLFDLQTHRAVGDIPYFNSATRIGGGGQKSTVGTPDQGFDPHASSQVNDAFKGPIVLPNQEFMSQSRGGRYVSAIGAPHDMIDAGLVLYCRTDSTFGNVPSLNNSVSHARDASSIGIPGHTDVRPKSFGADESGLELPRLGIVNVQVFIHGHERQ